MRRHSFDPISAALGLLGVVVGVLVVGGAVDHLGNRGGWLIALAAVVAGIIIVPWRPTGRSTPDGDPTTGAGNIALNGATGLAEATPGDEVALD